MTPLYLPRALARQIEAEGVAAYPNECCGILYGRDIAEDGETRRTVEVLEVVQNEFDEEEQYHRFLITAQTLMQAEKRSARDGTLVLGFYHSHPDHPARPSEYDRQHAWPFYSYVIVSVAQRQAEHTTCWVLDEASDMYVQQEIVEV